MLVVGQAFQRLGQLGRDTRRAMIYPAVVFAAIFAVALFWAYYVIPNLADLFRNLNASLPPFTLAVLAVLAYLADFAAAALGAQRYGASARSVWGATIGAVVGLFFGPVGLILGPFIGAVVGELSVKRNIAAAGRAGWGATIGVALGIAAKLALGLAMLCVFLFVRFL